MVTGADLLRQAYGQLPLSFEANQGQTDAQVNYLARGSGYALFLTPAEAVLRLQKPGTAGAANTKAPGGDVLAMQFAGANPMPRVVGLDQQAGTSNFLLGNDPTHWRVGASHYGKVEYQDLYPGIDLVYYGKERQLEYDFVVAPGANPSAIRLVLQGCQGLGPR
jgi:hypothetical protein